MGQRVLRLRVDVRHLGEVCEIADYACLHSVDWPVILCASQLAVGGATHSAS
jgi:hypothetical protein